MKRKLSLAVMFLLIGVNNTMAQGFGGAAQYVEDFVREYWPAFIIIYVLVGGGIAALTDGIGKNRDLQKVLFAVVSPLLVIILIGGVYVLAKSQNPL